MYSPSITTLLISFTLASATLADPATKGVDLELISEVTSIEAGKPFTVGLSIQHHDKYHTYWQNPGIVGVPTSLDWKLPDGFTAGPVQWPLPERVDMAGHPAHGYERDVLLMVEITPPAEIGKPSLTLEAEAVWMACAAACHPGHTTLSLTLPVGNSRPPDPALAARFAAARKELPRPLEEWTPTASIDRKKGTVTLSLTPDKPRPEVRSAYFFSSDGLISSDPPQVLNFHEKGAFELSLQRSEFGPDQSSLLKGVLFINQENPSESQGEITVKLSERPSSP